MSPKEHFQRIEIEVGSTVTVLTTGTFEAPRLRRKKHKDYEKDSGGDDFKDIEPEDDFSADFHHECKDHGDSHDHHKEPFDPPGVFTGVILGETTFEVSKDKRADHLPPPPPPVNVKEVETFLVLSLIKASPPFSAGQIVAVSVDQIVALAIFCD